MSKHQQSIDENIWYLKNKNILLWTTNNFNNYKHNSIKVYLEYVMFLKYIFQKKPILF